MDSFYETESKIWADLGWFGPVGQFRGHEFFVLFKTVLSTAAKGVTFWQMAENEEREIQQKTVFFYCKLANAVQGITMSLLAFS